MWNPFKKSTTGAVQTSGQKSKKGGQPAQPQNMGMLQRLAMKKLMSMSEAERQQMMSKFLTPENIDKNKDKIIAQMKQMKKSGMITDSQYEEGKKRLGL